VIREEAFMISMKIIPGDGGVDIRILKSPENILVYD